MLIGWNDWFMAIAFERLHYCFETTQRDNQLNTIDVMIHSIESARRALASRFSTNQIENRNWPLKSQSWNRLHYRPLFVSASFVWHLIFPCEWTQTRHKKKKKIESIRFESTNDTPMPVYQSLSSRDTFYLNSIEINSIVFPLCRSRNDGVGVTVCSFLLGIVFVVSCLRTANLILTCILFVMQCVVSATLDVGISLAFWRRWCHFRETDDWVNGDSPERALRFKRRHRPNSPEWHANGLICYRNSTDYSTASVCKQNWRKFSVSPKWLKQFFKFIFFLI